MQYKVLESHTWKPHISKCMPWCIDVTCWCNKDFTQCVQNLWKIPLDYLWCQYFSCSALVCQLFWLFIQSLNMGEGDFFFFLTRLKSLNFCVMLEVVFSCGNELEGAVTLVSLVASACWVCFSLICCWVRGTKGCE